MTERIDTTTAQLFAHLHRGGQYGYYWQKDGKRSTWWNGTGAPALPTDTDLYFGVHPSLAIPSTDSKNNPVAPEAARSRIIFVAAINCLFAEFDAKDFVTGKQGAMAHIEQLPVRPSVLIDSGGGYHAYWLLAEPTPITDTNREKIRDVQARWVAFVGSDGGAKDLARILRVPGTHNGKYDEKPTVTYAWAELDRCYRLDELIALLPVKAGKAPKPPKEPKPRKALKGTVAAELERLRTATNGARNTTLNSVAFAVGKMVAQGTADRDESRAELLAAAIALGLDEEEASKTIDSGMPAGEDEGALSPSALVMRGLHNLGYAFRLNLCDNAIEVNEQPLDDILDAEITTRAWDANIRPQGLIKPAYTTAAAAEGYHPVKDYLNGLEWDGNDHIKALAGYFTSSDAEIVYPDGTKAALHAVYLKRWLIGAVAKVLDRKQNVMLVLAGPQNIGKSYTARWLCSGIPDRFLEGPIRVDDKDSSVRLMSRFIWEVSELDATTRRSDVSALKDFITRDEVTVRKAFGRHDTIKPAMASMIGTVNECAGFLADESGNRRFMVTSITKIDWNYTKMDVNQVWAQAVALYRAGEPWRLTAHECKEQSTRNQAYDVESVLDGWLPKWFDLKAKDTDVMTAADIIDHLREKDIRLNGNERAQAMELSRVLTRLGVKKARSGTWRGYRGIAPRNDNLVTTYPPEVVTPPTAPESPNDNHDNHDNLKTIEMELKNKNNSNDDSNGAAPVQDGSHANDDSYLYKKKVDKVVMVVIEPLGSQENSDDLPPEVVTQGGGEVVTPYAAAAAGLVERLRAIRPPQRNITHESRLAASNRGRVPEDDDIEPF